MSPSDKLKDIRYKLGLSQFDISKLLSMNQSSWSNCEKGKRNLSLKKCYKLIQIARLKEIYISIEYLRPDE